MEWHVLEFSINNFKYGLDTRKDVLTSVAGTLQTCQNAFINAGGEVEQRKAFVEFANLAILDGDGFQGTFGLENTQVGITTFGSALAFGSSVTQGQTVLVSAMPAGVTYQQLKHPVVGNYGETYDKTKHRMTQVVFSDNFDGKAFVAAKFTDNNTFLYYDGACIRQSFNGLVLDFQAKELDLEGELEAIGWSADIGVDEFGNAETSSVEVFSPPNDYFTPLPEWSSTAGFIGVKNIDQDYVGTPGAKAVAGFKITIDAGTYTLAAPQTAAAATPTVDLCGGAVASQGFASTTCEAIARAVNDFTTYHGYTAISLNDSVFVYAPATFGAFTFNLSVTTTTATIAAAGAAPTALRGVISPLPLTVETFLKHSRVTTVKGDATIEASGGTAPYKFLWQESAAGSANGITLKQPQAGASADNVTASFSKELQPNTTVKGDFTCVITDFVGASTIAKVTVSLTATYHSGQ